MELFVKNDISTAVVTSTTADDPPPKVTNIADSTVRDDDDITVAKKSDDDDSEIIMVPKEPEIIDLVDDDDDDAELLPKNIKRRKLDDHDDDDDVVELTELQNISPIEMVQLSTKTYGSLLLSLLDDDDFPRLLTDDSPLSKIEENPKNCEESNVMSGDGIVDKKAEYTFFNGPAVCVVGNLRNSLTLYSTNLFIDENYNTTTTKQKSVHAVGYLLGMFRFYAYIPCLCSSCTRLTIYQCEMLMDNKHIDDDDEQKCWCLSVFNKEHSKRTCNNYFFVQICKTLHVKFSTEFALSTIPMEAYLDIIGLLTYDVYHYTKQLCLCNNCPLLCKFPRLQYLLARL